MSKPLSKTDKAQMLYRLGYRAHIRAGAIIVRNPAGVEYTIDAEAKTCTCRYAGRCSHLLGLLDLMLDTANALDVRALEHLECVRNCWSFSPEGFRLAVRAAALSDRVSRLRSGFEEWMEREERAAA